MINIIRKWSHIAKLRLAVVSQFKAIVSEVMGRVLATFELEKALHQLNYGLNTRATWLEIPLKCLLSLS